MVLGGVIDFNAIKQKEEKKEKGTVIP